MIKNVPSELSVCNNSQSHWCFKILRLWKHNPIRDLVGASVLTARCFHPLRLCSKLLWILFQYGFIILQRLASPNLCDESSSSCIIGRLSMMKKFETCWWTLEETKIWICQKTKQTHTCLWKPFWTSFENWKILFIWWGFYLQSCKRIPVQ